MKNLKPIPFRTVSEIIAYIGDPTPEQLDSLSKNRYVIVKSELLLLDEDGILAREG